MTFVEGQSDFYCTGPSGAITLLYDDADKEYLLPNTVYADYMTLSYSSWCDFAKSLGFDVDLNGDMELVMISAVVKTSKCSMGVWRDSDELGACMANHIYCQIYFTSNVAGGRPYFVCNCH